MFKYISYNSIGFRSLFPNLFQIYQPDALSGLSLWLKADSIGLSASASISTWSGSAGTPNVTQSVAANQPIYQLNSINGYAAVQFDGTNDNMEGPSITAKTAFIVSNYTKSSSFNGYAGAFTIDISDPIFTGNDGTTSWSNDFGVGNYYVDGSNTTNLGTLSAYHISYTTSDGTVTPETGKIKIGDDRYLGLGRYWQGRIAEIIAYDRILSSDELTGVSNYLNDKYNIY